MTVARTDEGNIIRKLLPVVLVIASTACTVFLGAEAAQADRTLAWAVPALVYLVATVVAMTPLAHHRAVHWVLTAVLFLAAIGIGLAFFILFGRQPSALLFGGMFFLFAVIEVLAPTAPKPA